MMNFQKNNLIFDEIRTLGDLFILKQDISSLEKRLSLFLNKRNGFLCDEILKEDIEYLLNKSDFIIKKNINGLKSCQKLGYCPDDY